MYLTSRHHIAQCHTFMLKVVEERNDASVVLNIRQTVFFFFVFFFIMLKSDAVYFTFFPALFSIIPFLHA